MIQKSERVILYKFECLLHNTAMLWLIIVVWCDCWKHIVTGGSRGIEKRNRVNRVFHGLPGGPVTQRFPRVSWVGRWASEASYLGDGGRARSDLSPGFSWSPLRMSQESDRVLYAVGCIV